MPMLISSAATRRSFLRTATLGGAALVFAGCRTSAPARAAGPTLRVALLSDTHIPADRAEAYRGFKPWENLRAAAPAVAAARPDQALICGDAARLEGKPEDYAELKTLLEPVTAVARVHVAMGNHDDRVAFRKAFHPSPGVVEGRHITVVENAAVRLILLDSLLFPNKTPGLLGQNQRQWLQRTLPELADRPCVLFLHHTLGERDGDLLDTERLLAIVRANRHVKAIFCGHAHVWRRERMGRLHVVTLPALGYNFGDREPVGWVEGLFRPGGVDLTLHAIAGDRTDDGKTHALEWAG